MNKDPYYQAFKLEVEERVLNPLFAKIRNPKPHSSKRKALQNALLRLLDKYFIFTTNFHNLADNDEVVVNAEHKALLQPLFIDTVSMIASHPNFTWLCFPGERLGKPGKVTLYACDELASLIDGNDVLKKNLLNLVESSW